MGREVNNKIRISCAAFASIKFGDKYLLCLNKNKLENGLDVFTPLGGALEYKQSAKDFLDNLGVEYLRETPDLRLMMGRDNLDLFEIWFSKRIDREVSVARELVEEMVYEEGILESLNPSDYTSEHIKSEKLETEMDNLAVCMYFEIFNVKFNIPKAREIFMSLENNDKIGLFTEEEILKGVSENGIKIGTNSKSILQSND